MKHLGTIHINGKTAPVDPAKQALAPGRIADSALARIKASTYKEAECAG